MAGTGRSGIAGYVVVSFVKVPGVYLQKQPGVSTMPMFHADTVCGFQEGTTRFERNDKSGNAERESESHR